MTQCEPKFVAYLRVSTARQGRSGLGLEAQREAVARYIAAEGGKLIAPEFVEVETGKDDDRPQLDAAFKRCRATGATLLVAKLDRLSRNAAFLMTLRDSKTPFIAVDNPHANTMTIGIMAIMAQHEREAISQRTKDALAAAKARGTALGGVRAGSADIAQYQRQGTEAAARAATARLADIREDLIAGKAEGLSLNALAHRLNQNGIVASRGGAWTATQVRRALARLG